MADVQSPVPGTFYRRPSPDADPFVEEGDTVEAGAVVGVVEVMKQFLDVPAPAGGTVGTFQIADGDAVSAGQTIVDVS
jgi:acetyl-CoA carboxylase biotin carboxyl carrier protein